MENIGVWQLLLLSLVTVFYVVPTVIAVLRRHEHAVIIAILNVGLGWSVIIWIGVLVWALIGRKRIEPVAI